MNKQKLALPISIVLGCVILGGFYYYSGKTNESVKTNEQKVGTEQLANKTDNNVSDYFNKKIECQKYQDRIEKEINQYNSLQKPKIQDSNNSGEGEPINHWYLGNKELKEIFYSPKIDSCVYVEISRTLIKSDPNANPNEGNWGTSFEYYNLIDILSGKQLESIFTINRSERMDSYNSDGTISSNVYDEADKIVNSYK